MSWWQVVLLVVGAFIAAGIALVVTMFITLTEDDIRSIRAVVAEADEKILSVRVGEDFTAITDCPKCGYLGVHWLNQPKHPSPEEWAEYEKRIADYDPFKDDEHRIVACSGQAVRTVSACPKPKPPRDESFTVARVCVNCAHRWGQR